MCKQGCHKTSLTERTACFSGTRATRLTHSVDEAVLAVLLRIQHAIFDEDRNSPQDERHEQVHVDEVPGTVQLPVWKNRYDHPG